MEWMSVFNVPGSSTFWITLPTGDFIAWYGNLPSTISYLDGSSIKTVPTAELGVNTKASIIPRPKKDKRT